MTEVEIKFSTIQDVRELAQTMRKKDRQEAEALGAYPTRALYYAWKCGLYRRTAFIDGKVAAMWGVAGCPLGLIGQPYFLTSSEVLKVSPIKFARIYKQEVEIMLKIFPVLENYVDARYNEAVRMLEIAGFNVSEPEKIFKGTFRKFTKRID